MVLPDLRDRAVTDPDPAAQGPGRPVRRPVGRLLGQRDPDDLGDHPFGQPRLAAPALGDHPDPGHAPLGEALPPRPDGVRAHPAPTTDLLVRQPVGGIQQALGLPDRPVRQRRRIHDRPQLFALPIGEQKPCRSTRSRHAQILVHKSIY